MTSRVFIPSPRRAVGLLLALATLLTAPVVHADAVDEAFVRGNELATQGNTAEALAAYQRAADLLGQPNSLLSYNLGTTYAELGDLGRSTFHLRQALDPRGRPTAELAEAARANLAIVRHRAEFQAATSGAVIDRPETWWDVLLEALRARSVGWLALLCGVAGLLTLVVDRVRRRRGQSTGIAWTLIIIFASGYLVLGGLHGAALRTDRATPRAIILDARVEARVGPGAFRSVEFAVQGGSQVRILDRTPGWALIQLPGGLEGWVPDRSVGELDRPSGRRSPSTAS